MKLFKNKYFITAIISLLIVSVIYVYRGIFPFGNNSVIWSDLHEQITAIYYKLYDAIKSGGSLFIDFSSGGAINLIGIIAYYILSPFTAIILLFPRDMIPDAVSIIVALKIVTASLTCLFFINRYFKKLKDSEKIFLSLLYAFSSYMLVMYLITGWIDIVYMFPLLMVGLKELLDLKDKKLYILTLALSIIFNYYLTIIVLIFVLIASGVYLKVFNEKNMKKSLLTLGICTLVAILLSSIILIPSLLQTLASERAGVDLHEILNSKFGPMTDKLSLLFTSGPLIAFTFLLLKNRKKHEKFISFILPLLFIMGLPIIIEPINKLWHLGSYVYFTYRYGFIFIFLLVIASAYYLEKVNNKYEIKYSKYFGIASIIASILLVIVALLKRTEIRKTIYKLSYSYNKVAFIIMFLLLVFIVLATIFLELNKNKKNRIIIYSISLISVLLSSYFYLGFYNYKPELKQKYDYMNNLNELKDETGFYSVKELERDLITNYGMVSGLRTYSNFTSLTEKNNFRTFQSLGYDSFWMDTSSLGGNLFTDTVLGYKYVVTTKEFNSPYYDLFKEYDDLKVYKFNKYIPLGYLLLKDDNLEHALDDIKNSFEASNIIYNYITLEENLFDIKNLVLDNTIEKGTLYEETLDISNKQNVYLEIFTNYESAKKPKTYESFNIYVNGELIYEKYPNTDRNGTLDLGIFENTQVNIKIEALKSVKVRNVSIGLLDLSKYEVFIDRQPQNVEMVLDGSSIYIQANSATTLTLFVPIPNIGYSVKGYELTKAFGNFLGIPLNYGKNIIDMNYLPKGIFIGMILTFIGLILLLLVDRVEKIYDSRLLNNIAYYTYMTLYYIIMVCFYIFSILAFLISFVIRI